MSGAAKFARQTILSAANSLIDGMGATTENLTDLGMRQLLPHGQPQQFLILRPQTSESVKDFLVRERAAPPHSPDSAPGRYRGHQA